MKRMKRILCFSLSLFLLLSCFVACSPTPDRITDEELVALREQYPYNDVSVPMAFTDPRFMQALQTWEGFMFLTDAHAVVVVELTGDWLSSTIERSPIGGVDPDELPDAIASVTGVFHPAKVEEVLWGGEELNKGDEIDLSFGALWPLDILKDTYQTGEKYVCFLFDYRENSYGIPSYFVEKQDTWHLTDQEVLVSASSVLKCIDDCSGMYLNTFEAFIDTTLGPPDAELTPVEPELETE